MDTNLSSFHLFTDEENVHFNVLGTFMINWVARQINSTHIITINNTGRRDQTSKLKKTIAKPTSLRNNIGNTMVFGLSIDLDNVVCRFKDQEMRLSPKNT